MNKEIIVGVHSIVHAIRNKNRTVIEIVACEEGVDKLVSMGGMSRKEISELSVTLVSSHKVQELAKIEYERLDFTYSRVPSGIMLITTCLEVSETKWIFDEIDAGKTLKILCLDGVTDVHNVGAIMRTAAFYNVDCIVFAVKNGLAIGPSTARIASGALEYVKILQCNSLPKFVTAIKKRNVEAIGLTEHTEDVQLEKAEGTRCLVLGAEDRGLSNATARLLDKKIRLNPLGKIESLNVSVAAAVAMEKVFS